MDVASGGFNYNVSLRLTLKGQDMQFERIFTAFTSIDLSSNKFQEEVPQAIGDLASLLLLNLSHNNLLGSIPDKLGSLDMLQSLDLSWNQFTRNIPEQLANLTSLAVLDLSQNQLDCGEISAKHVPPSSMPQQKDGSEDFASIFSWRDVLMGCGCGLVFGFIMGLVMLRIVKPEWFINISECCYQKLKRR
ncbi:receptor-like protein 34 [Capsicum galapagoense]